MRAGHAAISLRFKRTGQFGQPSVSQRHGSSTRPSMYGIYACQRFQLGKGQTEKNGIDCCYDGMFEDLSIDSKGGWAYREHDEAPQHARPRTGLGSCCFDTFSIICRPNMIMSFGIRE